MTNQVQVTLVNGVPTAPSGTVSTLDNLIGTAGTPSAQVQSMQGVSGGTAVSISAAALPLPTGAAAETGGNLATIATKVTALVTGTVLAAGAALVGIFKIGDGTNSAAIKAASAAAVATDPALVVAISPNNTVPVSIASLPSGAVTNAGTFAVQAAATLAAETVKVIGVTRTADGTGNLLTSTGAALDVNIKSGGGSGGTAATFGAAMPTTGTAIGLYDGTNQVRAKGDETSGLWVNIKAGGGSGGTASTVGSAAPTTATGVGFSDGTNMQLGKIKPASTAAIATDPAIVVAVSPNNTVPVSIASLPSGAVTNAGTFAVQNSAATPAGTNLIGKIELSDGTNTATVKAASTAPVATDPAIVVAISPNSVNTNGLKTPANSAPVVAADGYAQYETVAASATAQAMGATGATGDYLAGVLVFPGTAGCGVVTILDNATTIGTFAGGGTTALPSLVPFLIPVGLFSVSGAWKITTGANVTAVGIGNFT